MTNGDYIRSLSDYDLADVLETCYYCYCALSGDECDDNCQQHIAEWLGQERKCEKEL